MFPIGELRSLVELESVQVKVSLPGMSGLDLNEIKKLERIGVKFLLFGSNILLRGYIGM